MGSGCSSRARRVVGSIAVLSLLACGPEHVDIAEQDEVCGQPGPVRILELDDARPLWSVNARWLGDDRLLGVTFVGDSGFLDPELSQQWLVGPCGESPRLLADGTTPWRTLDVWPDTLLGCRSGGTEIVALDPSGTREPHVVFEVEDCNGVEETPWGLVGIESTSDDIGRLVLLRYPSDPWTQTAERTVLVDEIRIRADPPHRFPEQHEVLAVLADELFAITPDDELVHYSLPGGTTTPEATGVREFEVSSDLRWIVWQDVIALGDDPEWPAGAIYLRDREAGTNAKLEDAALAASNLAGAFGFADEGFVQLRLGASAGGVQRFYALSTLDSFDIPADREARRTLDPAHWLVGDPLWRGPFDVFDVPTRTTRTLFDGAGVLGGTTDEGIEVLEPGGCCSRTFAHAPGPLWSVPFDGSLRLLAHRASAPYRALADGRLLTAVATDDDGIGRLVAIDPGTLDEHRVDDRILASYWALDVDETLVYTVVDGERTGVWLTRLAP